MLGPVSDRDSIGEEFSELYDSFTKLAVGEVIQNKVRQRRT